MKPRQFEPDHYRNEAQDPGDCEPPSKPPCAQFERREFEPGGGQLPLGGTGYSPDIELYDLIDFSMPVGNTGIVFVAGLTGFRESDGSAQFIPGATAAAYRRAASTLGHMALVNGQTFQFIRLALNMSTSQAATLCGVQESEITDWEDGSTPVPATSWQVMADAAAAADQRQGIMWTALPTVDLRPRTIRIFPDVPMPTNATPFNPTTPC